MSTVSDFYRGPGGLVAAITAAVDAAGIDRDCVLPADLATVDEFHIRGRAASLEIADALGVTPDSHVVDLGSGLGGPARTVAEVTGCRVTGIDLTPDLCAVAAELSRWTGLTDRTTFVVGDATSTGLPSGFADAAMTVHASMNIDDKAALLAEAHRLLQPGGRLVVYDVLQGEGGDVHYPVPWAADPSTSFLVTSHRMRELLTEAGFDVITETDSSDEGLEWFRHVRTRIQQEGPPPVGFGIFLGEAFAEMAANQVANLAEGRIRTVMFVAVRGT